MKKYLTESSDFLNGIKKMGGIEIANMSSNIPTDEIEEWNNCLEKLKSSPDIDCMLNLIERWKDMGFLTKKIS